MGAHLLLTYAVIDENQGPQWEAAELQIENMTVEEFQDNPVLLDQFDPGLVTYHEDAESDNESGEQLNAEPLRDRLRADLRELREAIDGERTDIDYLIVRGAKVWVAGGLSWGGAPSQLFSSIHRLHLAGVLAAAGFDADLESTAAGENAGCDRCGTNDRAEHSRYCQACIDDGYFVHVAGRRETGELHDTAKDARDEALLVAKQTLGAPVEVRGPSDYRERIDAAVGASNDDQQASVTAAETRPVTDGPQRCGDSAPGTCRRCENPRANGDSELCAGCRNEDRGLCRWCGTTPPVAGSELCTPCQDAAKIVAQTGSF